MRFISTRTCVVALALLFAVPVQSALAGDGWRLVDTAGDVKAGGSGLVPIMLSNNQALPADAWVETKANGRAVLVRGHESIIVGPNSRVQLPNDEVNGNTQVLQTMGSALYQIGKQSKPHFQVDTPYLAAVVKGTQFTVTVDGNDATVSVSEGLVEVSTPDRSDVEFVPPGFTASVSSDRSGEVVVEKGHENSAPPQRAEGEKTASNHDSEGDTIASTASDSGSVAITVPIGDVVLDVKEVSGGLAFGEAKQALADTASDASEIAKDKDRGSNASGLGPVAVASVSDSTGSAGGGSSTGGGVPAPDLGGGSGATIDPGNGNGNGNGGGQGNGNGNAPDLGSGGGTVPDLGSNNGNGNSAGNGNGNAGGNGNSGGNGNGNANGHDK